MSWAISILYETVGHEHNFQFHVPVLVSYAAVTNYCKFSSLKQLKFVVLKFWRQEVQKGLQGLK